MKSSLSEEKKKEIIQDLNFRLGTDVNDVKTVQYIDSQLALRKERLQRSLKAVNDEVPAKIASVLKKAESNSLHIYSLKQKSSELREQVDNFIEVTEPFVTELDKKFVALGQLEEALAYVKSYSRIDELCTQMSQCKDDEQHVVLYGELKNIYKKFKSGHRGAYIKEHMYYWHNILKENFSKHYEEHLKLMKWPLTSGAENSPLPKEVMNKFNNLTKNLFLIQTEPEDTLNTSVSGDLTQEHNPCLPVKILLRPLKKRFAFHFTGSRQTARIDRPEWFLTQTLTWIKDHQAFVKNNVQPIADSLQMKHINTVDEFNAGLIALAAERLHTVLALYQAQGSKGDVVDVEAAFAHAVDETLGFHRELMTITENEASNILSVLTKAETFVQWLAVERKYALAKMDEILDNEQWIEPVAAGVGAAVGSLLWVPRGADWFITLLKTIEERYALLPQPGHRLQFLELQLELIEEWRIRLTQLISAAATTVQSDTFLVQRVHPLTAVINAAHHTHCILLQWAHCLHYLQLHYYRRQFQHFTQQQHRAANETPSSIGSEVVVEEAKSEPEIEETLTLNDVEIRAKKLALNDVTRQDSTGVERSDTEATESNIPEQIVNPEGIPVGNEDEEGAFVEVCGLLAHLRTAGVALLAEHILLEFKATLRDYKKQKWHSMVTLEEAALCVSAALCAPLSSLCARVSSASHALAPRLAQQLRAVLADHIDTHLYEEVVLENWFNTGGTLQFTHDVKRNLVLVFAQPNKTAAKLKLLPKLLEACKLLNMDYEDARRLREALSRACGEADALVSLGVVHLSAVDGLRILGQRTDLSGHDAPHYVMDLF